MNRSKNFIILMIVSLLTVVSGCGGTGTDNDGSGADGTEETGGTDIIEGIVPTETEDRKDQEELGRVMIANPYREDGSATARTWPSCSQEGETYELECGISSDVYAVVEESYGVLEDCPHIYYRIEHDGQMMYIWEGYVQVVKETEEVVKKQKPEDEEVLFRVMVSQEKGATLWANTTEQDNFDFGHADYGTYFDVYDVVESVGYESDGYPMYRVKFDGKVGYLYAAQVQTVE